MEVGKKREGFDLDRLEFMRLLLLSSGAALSSAPLFGSANASLPSPSPAYAKLHSLPPGAVRPEGWLRVYLEKQAQQLGSQLPHVSWPFTEAYWAGEEQAESWWPWEQCAYWIDGATRLSLVLKDEQLMHQFSPPGPVSL